MNTKLSMEEIKALIDHHCGALEFRDDIDYDYHTARLRKLALTYKLLTMTQTETN